MKYANFVLINAGFASAHMRVCGLRACGVVYRVVCLVLRSSQIGNPTAVLLNCLFWAVGMSVEVYPKPTLNRSKI